MDSTFGLSRYMNGFIVFLFSFLIGYIFFLFFSHPKKKKHRVPHIKVKNIELLPNFKIHFRGSTFWIHHWLLLVPIIVTSFTFYEGLQHLVFVKGAALGGLIQGLRYKDRFRIKRPRIS